MIMNKLIVLFAIASMAIATPVLALEVPEMEDRINKEVNSYRFIDDTKQHLATEEEFFSGRNGRDCEDYAAQKMRMLLRAGYTADRLDTVYMEIFTWRGGRKHLVLLIDGERILDNRSHEIYSMDEGRELYIIKIIVPAKKFFDGLYKLQVSSTVK